MQLCTPLKSIVAHSS